jgi:hypothetical protein
VPPLVVPVTCREPGLLTLTVTKDGSVGDVIFDAVGRRAGDEVGAAHGLYH